MSAIITDGPLAVIFTALGSIVAVYAGVPYILETARGQTKPRLATWLSWGALDAVTATAAFWDHQWLTGAFLSMLALECVAIVAVGIRNGDRKMSPLDITCLTGSLLGLVVLFVTKSTTATVVTTIVTDLIGTVPSFLHSLSKPGEETALTYALTAAGSFLTLLASNLRIFSAYGFPLYIFITDAALTYIILAGQAKSLQSPRPQPASPAPQALPHSMPQQYAGGVNNNPLVVAISSLAQAVQNLATSVSGASRLRVALPSAPAEPEPATPAISPRYQDAPITPVPADAIQAIATSLKNLGDNLSKVSLQPQLSSPQPPAPAQEPPPNVPNVVASAAVSQSTAPDMPKPATTVTTAMKAGDK